MSNVKNLIEAIVESELETISHGKPVPPRPYRHKIKKIGYGAYQITSYDVNKNVYYRQNISRGEKEDGSPGLWILVNASFDHDYNDYYRLRDAKEAALYIAEHPEDEGFRYSAEDDAASPEFAERLARMRAEQ